MDNAKTRAVEERPFPPPTISNWVRWRWVSTDMLLEELRWWADNLAQQYDGTMADG